MLQKNNYFLNCTLMFILKDNQNSQHWLRLPEYCTFENFTKVHIF